MPVHVESRSRETSALRRDAVRRGRSALRRLARRVPHAQVRRTEGDGPRGGFDKRCRVELRAAAGSPVVVNSMARDWHSALEPALARAARDRRRASQRGRARARASATAPAPGR